MNPLKPQKMSKIMNEWERRPHQIRRTVRGNFKALAHGLKDLGEYPTHENAEGALTKHDAIGDGGWAGPTMRLQTGKKK